MLIAKTPATDFGDTLAVAPLGDSALPIGTRLRDYEITGVIGEGDFAIVYLARDHSLQRQVAIKEYLPVTLASRRSHSTEIVVEPGRHAEPFEAGLKAFVNEARLLARFDHPSLIKVYRFWEENGTAYMVMPFHEGPTLKTALAELGHVPSEGELRTWLKPVLNAVAALHAGATWHQNIGPDEIVLTPVGPVLLGFGAAARAIGSLGHGPAAMLKPGFAALEQYGIDAATAAGPWTDLYSLAAVLYDAIAGAPPQAAPDRLAADALQPLSQVATGLYSTSFLAAIDAAMAVRPAQRIREHEQFRALMGDIAAPAAPVSLAPPRDLMQEPFLGDTSSHREITVPDRPLLMPPEPPAVTASAAAAAKSRARAGTDGNGAAERSADRPAPTWMQRGGSPGAVGGNRGKRLMFGIVAATCACVGIAALALNFYLRPAARTPVAPATAASSAAAASSVAIPGSVDVTPPMAATTAPAAVPTAAPATAPMTAATPSASAAAPAASPAASAVVGAVPAGQTARCIDILQKASLERISAADTEFFKKECK